MEYRSRSPLAALVTSAEKTDRSLALLGQSLSSRCRNLQRWKPFMAKWASLHNTPLQARYLQKTAAEAKVAAITKKIPLWISSNRRWVISWSRPSSIWEACFPATRFFFNYFIASQEKANEPRNRLDEAKGQSGCFNSHCLILVALGIGAILIRVSPKATARMQAYHVLIVEVQFAVGFAG
jgi:hypothetical protein